jgi:hypothetical protein
MNGRKGMKDAGKKERFPLQFQRGFLPVFMNNFKADGGKLL